MIVNITVSHEENLIEEHRHILIDLVKIADVWFVCIISVNGWKATLKRLLHQRRPLENKSKESEQLQWNVLKFLFRYYKYLKSLTFPIEHFHKFTIANSTKLYLLKSFTGSYSKVQNISNIYLLESISWLWFG